MHDVCYDTINAGNLYSNTSASLLSRYIYEKNISFHIPVAYGLLELEMTPGNKVCHHPWKFCIRADLTIVALTSFSIAGYRYYIAVWTVVNVAGSGLNSRIQRRLKMDEVGPKC